MKQGIEKTLLYVLPGLGDILWVAVFAGVIGLGPRMMNIDGDLGRHLTIGSHILDTGRVPTVDLFSHTMAWQPLTPHEWLAQVLFALAHRWMGLNGVVLLSALVIALTFWLVYRRAREASQQVLASVVFVVLAIAASSLHWLTRPHIFTFLLLALWWTVLEDMRAGKARRWVFLPVLMLIWANIHGAFIAGFVTWGLYGLGLGWDRLFGRGSEEDCLPRSFWRAYWLGGLSALLITLANPSGLGLWGTSVGYVGNRYLVGHTAEYLAADFHQPSTWPFLLMIGALAALFGLQDRRQPAAHIFSTAAWLVMGLYSLRNAPLFAILAAPVLASALAGWLAGHRARWRIFDRFCAFDQRLLRTEQSLRGVVWPVLVVGLVWAGLASGARLDFQQQGNTFDAQVFPVQAADWLKANPQPGNMFNYFPWGGYLLYRGWPDQRVFIDGQTDFYGEVLTRQYEQVLTLSPGWQDVLEQYQVKWVIMPTESALAAALEGRPGWGQVYADETAVIYTRR